MATTVAGRVKTAILTHETRRGEQLDEFETLSERAVALDPTHGPALALLATALGFRIA